MENNQQNQQKRYPQQRTQQPTEAIFKGLKNSILAAILDEYFFKKYSWHITAGCSAMTPYDTNSKCWYTAKCRQKGKGKSFSATG